MSKWKRNRNGIEGIPRVYVEERLLQFQEEQDWDAMIDVLGLLLYGVVLFPYVEDYVDLVAIEVFLAKRDRGRTLPWQFWLTPTTHSITVANGRPGISGAINYNPKLTSRQAGYPMVRPPSRKPSPLSYWRDCKPTGENTTRRSSMLRLTSSEKGSHGELEAVGSPQATGPGLNNESTSWVYHGVISNIKTKEPRLMKYRRHSRSRHSKAPWNR
ncbi:hypothetical protein CR513_31640, partial [Mucuna pruriens]